MGVIALLRLRFIFACARHSGVVIGAGMGSICRCERTLVKLASSERVVLGSSVSDDGNIFL